jgi:hypothetical protein
MEGGSTESWGLAAAAFALLLGAPVASAQHAAGEITASLGDALDGSVAEGQHLKLGEDGACSILVDQDAVVELCGQTSLMLKKDGDRRIVALDQGEIRIVVEPRNFEERIEIHTPAAIATLLGTIVHVSIDPVSGATTISSAESKVAVRSGDPDVRGTTVVEASEQVTVTPGEAPPAKPKRLNKEQVSELGGCLVDFHSAARSQHAFEHGNLITERLTAMDIERNLSGQLPSPVSAVGTVSMGPGEPLDGQEDVCVATDCTPEPEQSGQFGSGSVVQQGQ